MNNLYKILKSNPLFHQIEDSDLTSILKCLSAQQKLFAKNEIIFRVNDKIASVGIVLSGLVQIMKEDVLGNRTILANLEEGDMFGEAFACAKVDSIPVNVTAATDCTVLLIDYQKIITTCQSSCQFHAKLIENMLTILARKNVFLNQKIEYLSKRTTKDKLISYLSYEAQITGSNSFQIPFNRQELADYLCVDRSALSRELSKMKEEGILSFQKNRFKLQKNSLL